MKYTVISASLIWVIYLWLFVEAVMQRGLLTHPVYYVSAIIGIVIGFLSYRLMRIKTLRRRFVQIITLLLLIFLVITIAIANSGVEILSIIGSGLFFWYLFSWAMFLWLSTIMKWRHREELTDAEANQEYIDKGFVLAFLVLAALLIPAIVFVLFLSRRQ